MVLVLIDVKGGVGTIRGKLPCTDLGSRERVRKVAAPHDSRRNNVGAAARGQQRFSANVNVIISLQDRW